MPTTPGTAELEDESMTLTVEFSRRVCEAPSVSK
jgi:hypothetical protein